MGKLTKTIKAINKSASEIDSLDLDADTAEALLLGPLQGVQQVIAALLATGQALTEMGDEDSDDEDEDSDDEDSDDDAEDEDSDDDEDEDSDDDEDEDEDSDDEDEDSDDDEDEDSDDEDDDADFDDDEDEDAEDEDEDEEDEEPAPKKKKLVKDTKPAKKPAKAAAKPAKAAAAPAKKSKKASIPEGFADLKAMLIAGDKKRAGLIDKAVEGVGPRAKHGKVLALAQKKGWI